MVNKDRFRNALWLLLVAGFFAGHGFYVRGQIGQIDAAAALAFALIATNTARRARRRRHPRPGLKRGIIMLVTGILLLIEAVITKHSRDVMPAVVLIGFGVGWAMHWRYSAPVKIGEGA